MSPAPALTMSGECRYSRCGFPVPVHAVSSTAGSQEGVHRRITRRLMQVVVLCTLALGASRAFASIPDANGVYNGCRGVPCQLCA